MNVSAVVLAAGFSRRMGETNKLTLDVQGEPMLRHTVQILLSSQLRHIQVIVGHDAEQVLPLIEGLDVQVIPNPYFIEGQMTSVHLGLQSIPASAEAVMICLADQVLLTPQDINYLIDQFSESERDRILIPTFEGQRGNPIILPRLHVEGIVSNERNLGCRRLVEKYPELTLPCPMSNDHAVVDIDTPEDYQRVQQRLTLDTPIDTYGAVAHG